MMQRRQKKQSTGENGYKGRLKQQIKRIGTKKILKRETI
jgi:hypothetical protein